ncbi:MAG: ParA family protein [Candidatus Cyclobacteriaceae bacterium M3_2C_046]
MAYTIAVSNHKGGVGKTTTVINLGAGLTQFGKKVLLVDMDPQANLSQSLKLHYDQGTLNQALTDQAVLQTYDVAEGLEAVISSDEPPLDQLELNGKDNRLHLGRLLKQVNSRFDYILIDCPPTLGLLTINAFAAADEVLIPLQAEYLALKGLSKLINLIAQVQKEVNQDLKIGGIFLTQYDDRKILNKTVAKSLENNFPDRALKTRIRNNISIAEAPIQGKDIFRYNKRSNGAQDYLSLAKEIHSRHDT